MTMKQTTTRRIVLGSAAIALSAAAWAATAVGQRSRARAEFMRVKLEYSQKVLEGLTTENYQTIAASAKALKRISQAAEWRVPDIPNAADYIAFTNEFQRLADDIDRKANDKNIDGATLAYVQLTMNCVNCHKYVRQVFR
jgi:hypothetical protein